MSGTDTARLREQFCRPGINVRMTDNPARKGSTTGNCREAGTRLYVEVDFGPNERSFKDARTLSEDVADLDPYGEIANGSFGTDADLRRLLTLEKLRGRLTNVFYSMESSNTDFYPHQFKPVLKFLESTSGRLLIADEVGLGKTIEAGFIWKELQARETARRLLIICPAVLQEKWLNDLATKFSIGAQKINTGDLVESVESFLRSGVPNEFSYICSLQGARTPANFADDGVTSVAARLGRLLEQNPATEERAMFDLVIIDEAHYLRNVGTASNRLGNLLRDATRHLLLLTATPIHIHSDNLFQILRLVSPEDFFNKDAFDDIVRANMPVTKALRAFWSNPPDFNETRSSVGEALRSPFFQNHRGLKALEDELAESDDLERTRKIEFGRMLENASLLGQFMSRSRKRDVLENKVKRAPQVLRVKFTEVEKEAYEYVSERVRQMSGGLNGVAFFSVIARQAQMASCIVAALRGWTTGGFLDEILWDGLGVDEWTLDGAEDDLDDVNSPIDVPIPAGVLDLDELEKNDSKYKKLIEFLQEELKKDPNEKFVIFAFYRGTLEYLQHRLGADGVSSGLIMGGMGDTKWDIIGEFRRPDGPSVLLSSEVGSEGIDLQFCRFLVNYDLPWNPMRVEQRIGRLDRLGQKAERISIINLSLEDTLEERILSRLYERIELFESSIGDMEEILGEMTENLILELFEPTLSERERSERADQIADAILKQRAQNSQLEAEAINLVAYSDYVLDSIRDSKNSGRWLQPTEIRGLVTDFLHSQYPGTIIEPVDDREGAARISLSENARVALRAYKLEQRSGVPTRLDQTENKVECIFDPRNADELSADSELVDPTHPLLCWVRDELEAMSGSLHPTFAVSVESSQVNVETGSLCHHGT